MSQELHSDLRDAATELDTSMASVCREAVTEHLEVLKSDLDVSVPIPQPDDKLGTPNSTPEPLQESIKRIEPRHEVIEVNESMSADSPWYLRYSHQINNFHKGPARDQSAKKPTYTDRDEYDEMWSR